MRLDLAALSLCFGLDTPDPELSVDGLSVCLGRDIRNPVAQFISGLYFALMDCTKVDIGQKI
jgi:hypothetical protein